MAKTTSADIINFGFNAQMFKQTDGTFAAYINAIIAEQSPVLEGRLGTTLYNVASSPEKELVKRAEICLVAGEMLQRRINIMLANVTQDQKEIDTCYRQRNMYLQESQKIATQLILGITTDPQSFASGVLVTTHFDDIAEISGVEII